jgi:hypothetical protein
MHPGQGLPLRLYARSFCGGKGFDKAWIRKFRQLDLGV